jgi:drug/metabolite transporter (DMT)-like permease
MVLGERLAPAQLVGGALVLAAVILLQMRPRPVERANFELVGETG